MEQISNSSRQLVENGAIIRLDAPARSLALMVDNATLEARAANRSPVDRATLRGYLKLHDQHATGSEMGCDLDFLNGASGHVVTHENH